MAAKDETGNQYGRLTVVSRAEGNRSGAAVWLCVCSCGNTPTVTGSLLRKGSTTSCGCYQKETLSAAVKLRGSPTASHGMCGVGKATRTWRIWEGMKQRCLNPNNTMYYLYGLRGISVCPRWTDSFAAFLVDMGEAPPDMSLDRKDSNGNYEPGNCRWATDFEQANNRRSNRMLDLGGETKTLADWARYLGIKYTKLQTLTNKHPFPTAVSMALNLTPFPTQG